ncbi:RNA polymerase sigma factor [Actinokineospora sp. UTMC 2448]|uniref:RNA polymerase sigma factor n=1 Tax=Actinokineospora sp. UTMC 2448 TaxID=2268449 RepID=UPI002164B86C|nr:sigma-70 family RNA polymerase sigma factor [Actinokineospora sp. UTMC 2448]UVS81827.1 RNA polymerase sigma-D factor [Actinokineospora sp. UTMC 2448]
MARQAPHNLPAVYAALTTDSFLGAVAGARLGDSQALTAMVNLLAPAIRAYCQTRLRYVEIDDLVQDVLIDAIAALPRFTGSDEMFRKYVYAIASNKIIDIYRDARRSREISTSPADLPDRPDATNPTPEDAALGHENRRHLAALIEHAKLSPAERQVIALRSRGLALVEIAQQLDKSAVYVRVASHRAMRKLRSTHDRRS